MIGRSVASAMLFQSLGRDSVGWDRTQLQQHADALAVSIPRSGFCGVGLSEEHDLHKGSAGFNPSVGILWGGTRGRPRSDRL